MSLINNPIPDINLIKTKTFTLNLAQAAGTYTLATCNATGGVVITGMDLYMTVAGATFTNVSITTNDTTTVTFLTTTEGAVANLTVGKNVAKAWTPSTYLHTGKIIRYTITGSTGTGTMLVVIRYQSSVNGADIS